jgi:phage terminase large subunit-like protein
MRHFILPRPVAARSRRVFNPATMARLVAPPRCMQRPPARVWRTVGAVDMAPVAIAADDRLGTAVWLGAEEKSGSQPIFMVATAALVMRPPMAWTRAAVAAKMPLQSCPCTV